MSNDYQYNAVPVKNTQACNQVRDDLFYLLIREKA